MLHSTLTATQQKTAAASLGAAFAQDPFMSYMLPNADTRVAQLTRLFRPIIRCSLRYGGVEVAPEEAGALAWVSGEHFPLSLAQLVRSGLIWTPLQIGLPAFGRLQDHETPCEHALVERAPDGFTYLWVLGVHPKASGRGFAKQMVQSALSVMKRRGHSACLLRTDHAKNVPFYKHLGFKPIHTETVPASGLQYWVFLQELT